jgi:hypothetical protein
VRSGPGAARTILLFHIISARPSKQPLMVRTFLKVYGAWLLFFVSCYISARTNTRQHHLLGPLNSLVWYVTSLRYTRGLGWRIHCGVENTESNTNKQHIRESRTGTKRARNETPPSQDTHQGVLLTNKEYKRQAAATRYSGCPLSLSRRNARMEEGAEGVGGAVCATG